MQIADTIMTVIRSRGERGCSSIMGDHKDREHMRRERETLESRMMRKYQVRFGGGLMEKGPQGNLASFLPDHVRQEVPAAVPAELARPSDGDARRRAADQPRRPSIRRDRIGSWHRLAVSRWLGAL
jgi:hypothetical protein